MIWENNTIFWVQDQNWSQEIYGSVTQPYNKYLQKFGKENAIYNSQHTEWWSFPSAYKQKTSEDCDDDIDQEG